MMGEHGTVRLQRLLGCAGFAAFRAQHVDDPVGSGDGTLAVMDGGVYAAAFYARLEHWTGLARLLERGLFDGLFLADVLGIYDVYGGSPDAALRGAVQVPLLDPLLLVPAMAAATEHLGFGVTCNLAYEPPYLFARRMSTLDHLAHSEQLCHQPPIGEVP